MNDNDKMIKKWLQSMESFINNHSEILFTRADKGNTMIVLDRNDYNLKIEKMLSDLDMN